MQWVVPVFGDKIIQFQNGEEARQRRRHYDAFFSNESVKRYFNTFRQVRNHLNTTH